jgi:hypothetical protein
MLFRRSVFTLLALLFSFAIAQNPFTEFKLGFLSPADADKGLFFGVNSGRMIDEAVSWSLAVDFYTSSFTKESTIEPQNGEGVPQDQEVVTEIENSSFYMPLLARLNYERNLPSGLVLRGGAGIGYALMWINENNYSEGIEKTRFYSGLAYRLNAGVGIQISSTANFFLDLEYNGGEVSRDRGRNDAGLPVRSDVSMAGVGLRLGVSIFNFGF